MNYPGNACPAGAEQIRRWTLCAAIRFLDAAGRSSVAPRTRFVIASLSQRAMAPIFCGLDGAIRELYDMFGRVAGVGHFYTPDRT